jgi:CRP/FNR family transcriptional regulator, polysaccharide utilization system transcription regulator
MPWEFMTFVSFSELGLKYVCCITRISVMVMKKMSGFSEACENCTSRRKSIFCHLGVEELGIFNATKSCISFKKGQQIFNEGNHPIGLYCIHNGKVKLAHGGSDGKEQIVRMAKSGDVLGYRALLSEERYNAGAVALDDSDICFIPRDTFFLTLKANAGLSLEIIKMLANELRNAEQTITDLAQKPVRERMAEALLFLKETYGLENDGTINVILSREDIANLVGTATETAIRLLSEFKHDNIIELVGKKIRILNNNKLVKTANIYN